jgi:hypothetical protein
LRIELNDEKRFYCKWHNQVYFAMVYGNWGIWLALFVWNLRLSLVNYGDLLNEMLLLYGPWDYNL